MLQLKIDRNHLSILLRKPYGLTVSTMTLMLVDFRAPFAVNQHKASDVYRKPPLQSLSSLHLNVLTAITAN